ncbi:hypothetical protein [Streptomyces hoynatensis]|uniref:Terminase small subunit n=1 Tax=Streptomyces hoynatensis TaxID=1141874 RepID=A0A3A9YYG5_9ACTN|nr:hypothetical protein [Streptomyces hoynatensis]RKN40945.1 hypothetical protein D7294_17065 [Streptomyces hoynatensis]
MAGRGPAPKDPKRRARRNADAQQQTVLRFEQAEPPELPTLQVEQDGKLVEFTWPHRTVEWWEMWKASPQAEHFSSTDWDFLLDTALVHARFWTGNLAAGAELRLRVAKFGATPEDRARLRMQFAQADEADSRRPAGASSRERYGDLKVLPGGGDAVAGS